jgi:hypothetical protein
LKTEGDENITVGVVGLPAAIIDAVSIAHGYRTQCPSQREVNVRVRLTRESSGELRVSGMRKRIALSGGKAAELSLH